MDTNTPKFSILLIDDDAAGPQTIQTILKTLTDAPFRIDHVLKCSQALALLRHKTYELVLLDNRLSQRISAKFSVPMIRASIKLAPIVIISKNDASFSHADPLEHGVDYVVDKSNMIDFLKSQLDYLLSGRGQASGQLEPVS